MSEGLGALTQAPVDLSTYLPRILAPDGTIVDPTDFLRTQRQLTRLRATCSVFFNGQDITSKLDPSLLMVRITDRDGGISKAEIDIDDSYAKIPSPPDGAQLAIALGWPTEGAFKVFKGMMDDITSSGSKRAGRILTVTALGVNTFGPAKTPITGSFGTGNEKPEGGQQDEGKTFGEVVKEIGEKAGIQVTVAPRLAEMRRKYWEINNENALSWIGRMAQSMGGSLKVAGGEAGVMDLQSNLDPSGAPLGNTDAVVGENVLAWRIKPRLGRPQWGKLAHGFFDRDKAGWQSVVREAAGGAGFGNAQAGFMGAFSVANEDVAGQLAAGDAVSSVRDRGTGWIAMDGEPLCRAGGLLTLHGSRPDVDGQYRVSEVEHTYIKGGGFTTRADVNMPQLLDSGSITGGWTPTP